MENTGISCSSTEEVIWIVGGFTVKAKNKLQ